MLASPILHDPFDATTQLAGSLLATVKLARGLVEDHRAVDLAGLDGEIGRLCARMLDLPLEQGRRLQPALVRLARALDALAVALEHAGAV